MGHMKSTESKTRITQNREEQISYTRPYAQQLLSLPPMDDHNILSHFYHLTRKVKHGPLKNRETQISYTRPNGQPLLSIPPTDGIITFIA